MLGVQHKSLGDSTSPLGLTA